MLLRIRTLGFTVHVLRIDNDSVFLGAEFRAVCDEFGVDIQRNHWYLIPCFGVRARDVSRARTLLHERTTGLTHAHDVRTHMRAHI